MSKQSIVEKYLSDLHTCLDELPPQDIEAIAGIIFNAYKKGKRIFLMGNGGSAATSSHFARDLRIGTACPDKPRLQAISITDNTPMVTAIANDTDYSNIFREQLIGQLKKGDVVIAISASGNSPNVIKAVEYARSEGAVTIGLTGFSGGKLSKLADKSITLSSRDYGPVEDIHLCLAHMISYLVREKIASG